MAKDSADKTEGAEKGKPAGKMKKILFMAVPVLAVGAGAYFFLGGGGDEAAPPTTMAAPIEGEVIALDTMTVNLIGEERRYAKVGFAVVLDSLADSGVVGSRVPLIQDAALGVMTHYDAPTLQSAAGQERLRQELTDATVLLFPDGEVLRVVLTELIVQ
jgi:flagellar FliL protein